MTLAPLRTVCTPRPDVLSGGLDANHFAAQLDKALRDPAGYPVYGDPDEYFAITYPTSGFRSLLEKVFARVTGAPGSSGVIRPTTSFGGGKSHIQVGVLHLARGARPSNLSEFVDPALMPSGPVPVAALVGDTADPIAGVETNGRRSYTWWGEMASQLGDHAWQVMEANDINRQAPGVPTLRGAFNGQPAIILIDEIAQYLRSLATSGSEDVRRMAGALPVFLKNLFEVASDPDSKVVVVITLASQVNAFGEETNEIQAVIDDADLAAAEAAAVNALDEAADVLTRSTQGASVIKPAADNEIGEILKRRLFADIDPAAADAAANAYRALYEGLLEKGEQLSGGPEQPVTYADTIRDSYPFHPELVRVLDKRLGDIPKFQRARGALKLLSDVISCLYRDQDDAVIINVAELDYSDQPVLADLTVAIDKGEFEGVALADVAGHASHAAGVDRDHFAGHPWAERVNRTVFTHSLESKNNAGASENDWLVGTLQPGEDPDAYQTALKHSLDVAWHLSYDGNRYRYLTEPNVNKIIEEEKRNVLQSAVNQMMDDLVHQAFKNDGGVTTIIDPQTAADIPDTTGLRVVIIDPAMATVINVTADTPPSLVVGMYDKAGAAGHPRKYRNAVTFVVADDNTLTELQDKARALIAAEQLAHDGARMAEFSDDIRAKIEEYQKKSRAYARIAVSRAYKHVYFPTNNTTHNHLRHLDLPAQDQGNIKDTATISVVRLLEEDGKIRDKPLSPGFLRSRAWPSASTTITTKDLADHFWIDHRVDIIRNTDLLLQAIRAGVTNSDWVYLDGDTGKVYTAAQQAGFAPEIRDTAELMPPAEATNRGLLVRIPSAADVKKVHRGASLTGTELRGALEAECGGEPKKADVLEALANAVQAGQYKDLIVIDTTPATGVKALTPSDIRSKGLDGLIIITRAAADAAGVEAGGIRVVNAKTFKASGAGASALQTVLDQVGDHTITTIKRLDLKTSANEVTGRGDIDLAISGLGMLPAHPITVELTGVVEYPALDRGEIEVTAAGSRSEFQAFWTTFNKALTSTVKPALDLIVTFQWETPIDVADTQITTLQQVIKDLQIGSTDITAEVSK